MANRVEIRLASIIAAMIRPRGIPLVGRCRPFVTRFVTRKVGLPSILSGHPGDGPPARLVTQGASARRGRNFRPRAGESRRRFSRCRAGHDRPEGQPETDERDPRERDPGAFPEIGTSSEQVSAHERHDREHPVRVVQQRGGAVPQHGTRSRRSRLRPRATCATVTHVQNRSPGPRLVDPGRRDPRPSPPRRRATTKKPTYLWTSTTGRNPTRRPCAPVANASRRRRPRPCSVAATGWSPSSANSSADAATPGLSSSTPRRSSSFDETGQVAELRRAAPTAGVRSEVSAASPSSNRWSSGWKSKPDRRRRKTSSSAVRSARGQDLAPRAPPRSCRTRPGPPTTPAPPAGRTRAARPRAHRARAARRTAAADSVSTFPIE